MGSYRVSNACRVRRIVEMKVRVSRSRPLGTMVESDAMVNIQPVRPPAVAGLFYPADSPELEATVRAHLEIGSGIAAGASGHRRRANGLYVDHSVALS